MLRVLYFIMSLGPSISLISPSQVFAIGGFFLSMALFLLSVMSPRRRSSYLKKHTPIPLPACAVPPPPHPWDFCKHWKLGEITGAWLNEVTFIGSVIFTLHLQFGALFEEHFTVLLKKVPHWSRVLRDYSCTLPLSISLSLFPSLPFFLSLI